MLPNGDGTVAHIFISHKSDDRERAEEVREWLFGEGFQTFLSSHPEDGIAAGANWEATLYDEIRRTEIDRARRRLGPLTPEQEKAVEAMTSGIVNKILHPPTVELKKMASNRHHTEYVGLIRKLFGL